MGCTRLPARLSWSTPQLTNQRFTRSIRQSTPSNIILSFHHPITTPTFWSHVQWQVKDFDTYWVVYPFAKELSPKINELQAITFDQESASDAQTIVAPPKHLFIDLTQFLSKKHEQKVFGVEKWNVANRLKRVLPKFRADPSHPQGVNGHLKFQISKKIWFLPFSAYKL